ncbi:MAG: sugar phosphate isomerase/epimerase [Clostridiales bacterium]|nr:sugar phosphate isomerase/epimerase [Clostridiales bacterium]
MIPISVQTGGITDVYGIDEGYRMIKAAGFDGVDANIDHLLSYGAILRKEAAQFVTAGDFLQYFQPWKDAAEKYGVQNYQAHAPFPCVIPDGGEYNEFLMKMLKRMIQGCRYIGCGRLIIHPFFFPYDRQMDKQTEWDMNIEKYSALIDVARENDVIICLENMFTGYRGKIYSAICSDIGEACRYIDTLNEIAGERRFGFCLDTGHLLLLGLDIGKAIRQLGDRIEALHVHDNNGISDQHLCPYMGILDWNRMLEALHEIGYNKPLSLETFNTMVTFDRELGPQVLKLEADTARMFARRIENGVNR